MSPPFSRRRAAQLVLPVLLFAAGCKGDGADVHVTADFVGNWVATSFVLDGEELITPGAAFNVSVGFFEDGSYQLIAGGDDGGVICVSGPSCVETGDFSFTGTIITLDPGTTDEIAFEYSVSGNTLMISGDSSLGQYSAVFEKV